MSECVTVSVCIRESARERESLRVCFVCVQIIEDESSNIHVQYTTCGFVFTYV